MKPSPSILRRIRSALRLAADHRAPKGEARSAARMAAKLMRKHGVTEADLWHGKEQNKPGAKSVRLPVNLAHSEHLPMFVTRLTMFRFPQVQIFLWTSRVNLQSGAMEFLDGDQVDAAAEFWKQMQCEVRETWLVMQKLGKVFPGASCFTAGALMPSDSYSWLAGICDGFEAEDNLQGHSTREHPEFPTAGEEASLLAEPRKKRRTLPRRNPLALGPIFRAWEPSAILIAVTYVPPPMTPSQWCEANFCLPKAEEEPKLEPVYILHQPSYASGLIYGRCLAIKF